MTLFLIAAIGITLIVLVALLRPLLKPSSTKAGDRRQDNINYAKQRLAELNAQQQSGVLSDEDYAALRKEIETTLAQDIDLDSDVETEDKNGKQSNTILVALLCSPLPISALLIYMLVGTPQALNSDKVQNAQPTQATDLSEDDIRAMIAKLQKRMEENPNDPQGWQILARTLLATGQYQESIEANKKLLEINGEDADVYAAMADASAILAGGTIQGQPLEYVQRALSLEPLHPQSLWLAGLAAAQQGDTQTTVDYWNKLMPLLADIPEQQQELASIIEQTKNAGSESASNSSNQEPSAINGLTVQVTLAEEIKPQVNPDDIVFVLAKAKQGPPAPLAVKRLTVKDLPTQITLSDADSMVPQFSLSKFKEVVVVARVAKSGEPVAKGGDIESAQIETTNNHNDVITLEISKVLR